ncbi:unnamed protein product [Microthlaspi erraticum]|uniref:OTU domain-containing protein n=1 Tax=Microthlaspi erraticum TaxID=1685480 RepID=A0A6D2KG09_9BRAS|nr:unnamed protein product [Microthlaspi erraticum]
MPNTRIKSRCLDDLTDQERLQDRLEWEGYTEKKMKSDGNCQFRAIADQVYKSADFHKRVRQEIVQQLKSRPNAYKEYYGKLQYHIQFKEYVQDMSNDSEWGDDITLRAAADVYGVKIVVIASYKDIPSFVILPKSQKEPDKVIHLSYLEGAHYDSIHLRQGSSTRKKNKEKDNEKEKENEDLKKEKDKEDKKNKREKAEKNNKKKLYRRSHFSNDMLMPL